MSASMAVVMALCVLVILAMVALVVAVVWVGASGRGYDVDACFAAYEQRKAEGEALAVMEPAEHEEVVS